MLLLKRTMNLYTALDTLALAAGANAMLDDCPFFKAAKQLMIVKI